MSADILILPNKKNLDKDFLAAHFAKRNTKFGGGESEGGAGIPFPPTPFPSRPARAFSLAREARHQFRSKKFRAKFRISHQSQLSPFWERIASRLRRSAFGLCALRKATKSHGGQKEKEMDLSFSYLK